jgi:two-component system nitrogen regulation response regulator GlnG
METKSAAILVVDDEDSVRFVLARALSSKGYHVEVADGLAEAERLLRERAWDVVFLDVNLPGGSGFGLFEAAAKTPRPPAVVVMTAQATMQNAVTAMRKGAFDYITKPFDLDMVEILAGRILEYRAMERRLGALAQERAAGAMDEMAGNCAPMQALFKFIGRAADLADTVLITGPTGAGKELVARGLHFHSRRAAEPFVAINLAAAPGDLLEADLFGHVKGAFTGAVEAREGKFAAAGEGTLLLDEIGDMPMALQAKILRVLQEREYTPVGSSRSIHAAARIIAATNKSLEDEVRAGRFREDLYHRLNVLAVKVPGLDERKEDIPLLVEAFLRRSAKTMGVGIKRVSPEAMAAFMARPWPGNVRELENAVRRAVALAPGGAVTLETVPGGQEGKPAPGLATRAQDMETVISELYSSLPAGSIYQILIRRVEKALVGIALERAGGALSKAANELGLNRNTLAKKIAELGAGKPRIGE